MQIVLFRSVDNLGSAGEIVEVKRGYYRNFLGPRGFAKIATKANIALMESRRKKLEAMVAREREEAKTVAQKIDGAKLSFSMRANDSGQLFGSVTSMDVAKGLADQGLEVDRRKIEMPENLKSLGEYPVRIRIYPEVYAEIVVTVERELRQDEIEALEAAAAATEEIKEEEAAVEAAEEAADEAAEPVVSEES